MPVKPKEKAIYANAIENGFGIDNRLAALILLDEVRKRVKDKKKAEPDFLYSQLLSIADEKKMISPFVDKAHFYNIYENHAKIDERSWLSILEYYVRINHMMILPDSLLDIYTGYIKEDTKTVLIAEAEKFAGRLNEIVDSKPDTLFTLSTEHETFKEALQRMFEDRKNVKIILAKIYEYEFTDKRYDLIIACPTFGVRNLVDGDQFMCRDTDLVALENLLLHLTVGGKLAITMPAKISFSSGKIGELRRFVETTYYLNRIAELPEGTVSGTGIRLYFFVIKNSRPVEDNDIIIQRFSAGGRKSKRAEVKQLQVTDDTFIMYSELIDQGDWSVDRIFSNQDEEYMRFHESDVHKVLIGDVATVFRGKSVTQKDPNGPIGVINIANIGEYELNLEEIDHINMEERKVSNYLLKEGDLLLPARGTAIRTSVFRKQHFPCIASSNVIVIRPEEGKIDSTYLKIFLDSPIGKKRIEGLQQGTSIINISYKELNELEIPAPPMEEQKKVVKKYLEELEKYETTVKEAEKRWNDVLDELYKF